MGGQWAEPSVGRCWMGLVEPDPLWSHLSGVCLTRAHLSAWIPFHYSYIYSTPWLWRNGISVQRDVMRNKITKFYHMEVRTEISFKAVPHIPSSDLALCYIPLCLVYGSVTMEGSRRVWSAGGSWITVSLHSCKSTEKLHGYRQWLIYAIG